MIQALYLLATIVGTAIGTDWDDTPSLNVKFGLSLTGSGTSEFIEMPLYKDNATKRGWVETPRPASPEGLSSLVMYCPSDDNSVCTMYDDTGYIAGLQFALDKEFLSEAVHDWKTQGFTEWNLTLTNGTDKSYWTQQQYYILPESLKTDPAVRIASRNSSTVLQEDYILVTGFDGVLFYITRNVQNLTGSDSIFKKQGCFPWMGRHYYYNMTTNGDCSNGTIFPWFPLIDDGVLIALGSNIYAKYNAEHDWFERPPRAIVEWNVPEGPDCVYDLADSPGLMTLHTYFYHPAQKIICDNNE